ncbi:MAG: glycosyltransferase [Gammaproteobacteria bacterium]|nr:glycosyltransferase [Gammaproteobacteria bacterium]
MDKAVWVTWENQRRNKSLSKKLGVTLFQLEINSHRILRYPILILKTLMVLLKHRPRILFAQNPSIILALFIVIYGQIFGKRSVIDCHNAGVYPFEGKVFWATQIARYIFRNSHLIIVTNESLKAYVESHGGEAYILPDPFPSIKENKDVQLAGELNFLLICTWAADEPYKEVFEAFSSLNKNWVLYVTGNSKGKEKYLSQSLPSNVVLTGYIPDEDFDDLLNSCDCVIDLTTREDCLVCGAYEAVAVGKPVILSGTDALKAYFLDAAIYTENNVEQIAVAVKQVAMDLSSATKRVIDYRKTQEEKWNIMLNRLVQKVTDLK